MAALDSIHGAVGLAAQQAGARRGGAQGAVAAAVIDVGVGDQHVVDVGERPAQRRPGTER